MLIMLCRNYVMINEVDDYFVYTDDDDQNILRAGHSVKDFDDGVYATFFVTLVISFVIGIALPEMLESPYQRCWKKQFLKPKAALKIFK